MPLLTQARTWGTRFDTLLSSPSTQLDDSNDTSQDSSLISNESCDDNKKSPRVVQDASIFIGSLPANIEHSDLTCMLSDHLSGHPEVQTVKVIRDSKGGTCAFIHCQDAETAAALITNLRSSSTKPFMGRNLRYEPARAMRTLVVSYRSPRQFSPSSGAKIGPGGFLDNNIVELDLPWAMKISRVSGVRYLSVLYNSDARAAAENEGILPLDHREASESGAYLFPLLFNAETLKKISAVFGSVEHFVPYELQEYPPPHDAPRSKGMEKGCWEIKWRHRDDCVSALMTLRRVPHLTVTWAHHPAQTRQPTPPQPVRTDHRQTPITSFKHMALSHSPPPNQASSINSDSEVLVLPPTCVKQTSSSVSLGNSPNQNRASIALCDMTWPSQNVVLNTRCKSPKRPRALSLNHNPETRKLWSDCMEATEEYPSLTSFNSMSRIPEVSSSSPHFNTQVDREGSDDIEVDIPLTPEIGTSPVTPQTPGSLVPRTPTTGSYLGDFQSRSLPELATPVIPQWNEKREGSPDPTTVFVGGLEMYGPNSWNEERVRNFFSRYGTIESVKVVRPVNKRSAFAFVKFNNKESSARAISQEHNRIIDGRSIRVQLRDWNPQHRGAWRSNHNHEPGSEANIASYESEPSLISRDHFRVNPSLQRPTMIASLEDRLQELNIGEKTVTKVASPNALPNIEQSNVPSGHLQPVSSVVDDEPTSSFTDAASPPTTVLTSSTNGSTMPFDFSYPPPTMGYYPQGWVAGAPTYPIHYMGAYPGYPLPPSMDQSFSPANNSDTHRTPSGTLAPFIPPFIPYHPYSARTPVREQGQGQTHGATQAPLLPTGFIHGDQGILVPVYPQDALNQYMSDAQDRQTSASELLDTPPSLPCQPPNVWRPYLPPAFAPRVPTSSGIQHTSAGAFPMTGPQGLMSHQVPLGINQHMYPPSNGPLGSGTPKQPMFEHEQRSAPSRRQYRKGNHPHVKNGGRGQPERYPRGSFVPN